MKLLIYSSFGVPTGYGRMASELVHRITYKGYEFLGASDVWDGSVPISYNEMAYPGFVAAVGRGRDRNVKLARLCDTFKPDILLCIQDMTHACEIYEAAIDWSVTKLAVWSPVDGAPIPPRWARVLSHADLILAPTRFGQEAYRDAGLDAKYLPVGIHATQFSRTLGTKRSHVGISDDTSVLGTMAHNQVRKNVPAMMEVFHDFARGKDALYILDMDKRLSIGWDLPEVIIQQGWDPSKFRFRSDGLAELNMTDRYNLLDAHALLSRREGIGLPMMEAQACGVISIGADTCAGAEIVGDDKGFLIPVHDFTTISNWGGAREHYFKAGAFRDVLEFLYDKTNLAEHSRIRRTGRDWAVAQTWEHTANRMDDLLRQL